ncbi:GNAT family N-acetyltransferase [bacterium]|nr:GNAT family N-acetyltransferase [bacterium]
MRKVNKISVSIIQSSEEKEQALRIREIVFVDEQKVTPEIEYDEFEDVSTHVIAYLDQQIVGTARWRLTEKGYKLERFAVLSEARGKGVGAALVEFIIGQIDQRKPVYLNSQLSALTFYLGLGFRAKGEVFYEANIPHRKMYYIPNSES